jgi:hypothetical protein
VSISPFPRFSLFFAIFQVVQCAFLIFDGFQYYSPCSRSYSVCFSFSTFFSSLAIFQVLKCPFLVFYFFFSFSSHIPCPKVLISHFPRFSVFLAISQVLKCVFLIFHVFKCFSLYFRY